MPLVAPAILIFAAVALLFAARWSGMERLAGTACLAAIALAGCGLSYFADRQFTGEEVALDSFALTICWAALGLGFCLTLMSLQSVRQRFLPPERYAGLLFALAGLMVVGLARDLIVLLLGLELIAFPSLLLWLSQRDSDTTVDNVSQSLFLGLLSTALLWFGVAVLYGISGTTRLPACLELIAAGHSAVDPASLMSGTIRFSLPAAVLILAGLAMRMPVAPFQFGTTELADAASSWHAAFFATVSPSAPLVAAWRLFGKPWNDPNGHIELMLTIIAVTAMIVGGVMANTEQKVRRLLAYAGMAHAGFALLGVSLSAAAGFFYLGGYLIAVVGLLAVMCYLARRTREVEYVEDLRGLIRGEPVAAICAATCSLSLAGLPPLPLFWGNLMLQISASSDSSGVAPSFGSGYFVLIGVAAAGCLLLAAVYLRLVTVMLLSMPIGPPQPAGGQTALAVAVLAAFLTLGLGLFPAPLLEHLDWVVGMGR